MQRPPFKKICIIGISGQFGHFLARFFLKSKISVLGISRTKPKGLKHKNFSFLSADCTKKISSEVKQAIQACDVVLFSLPIGHTLKGIKVVAPHLQKEQLLTDVTSVKELPCATMKTYAPKSVEVLGMHPMFSPTLNLADKNVILTKERVSGKTTKKMQKLWADAGANVSLLTAKEHDKLVAVMQGLAHFVTWTYGKTLQELKWNFKKNKKYETTYFKLLNSLLERVLQFDPHLYTYIQTSNPQNKEVLKQFLKSGKQLYDLVENQDNTKLKKEMEKVVKAVPKRKDILDKTNKMYKILEEKK